jgi:S-adenosylmethionine:diacylglycerol 3-amino-3-carboxypropyl transferase
VAFERFRGVVQFTGERRHAVRARVAARTELLQAMKTIEDLEAQADAHGRQEELLDLYRAVLAAARDYLAGELAESLRPRVN